MNLHNQRHIATYHLEGSGWWSVIDHWMDNKMTSTYIPDAGKYFQTESELILAIATHLHQIVTELQ